jgi:hypothetical protein
MIVATPRNSYLAFSRIAQHHFATGEAATSPTAELIGRQPNELGAQHNTIRIFLKYFHQAYCGKRLPCL